MSLDKIDERHTSYGAYQSSHHHERHWGPYFEGEGVEVATQVTAHVGSEALLNCRVGMLKDKTVRRQSETVILVQNRVSKWSGIVSDIPNTERVYSMSGMYLTL